MVEEAFGAPAARPGPGRAGPADVLSDVVEQVRTRRRAGAPSHPANILAPERWLRSVVIRNPDLVGAAELSPASPPEERPNLRANAVAPALGTDADGTPVVVVCSTGIDPELVPAAAEVRASAPGARARLVLVVPARDDHPMTRHLAARLVVPAEVTPVPDDWRTYPG